jgi:SAM-dependent methyltransferase
MHQRPCSSSLADLWFVLRRARRSHGLRFLRKFLQDRGRFIELGGTISDLYPVFDDFRMSAGSASGHYFHQDLLVAQFIHDAAPRRHVDVGSRVDGFVAHVASFRAIDVLDIRPMPPIGHPNISFVQADLARHDASLDACTDSLSCLHVLEHIGLGRYGDPIDPEGHRKGLDALARMVEPGGRLYISSPIGRRRICFNAHRVFDPCDFPTWLDKIMLLDRFDFVDDHGSLHTRQDHRNLPPLEYGCGIYSFRRPRRDEVR